MKVAICCLNSKYIHASLAPWCLLGSVKELCPNVQASVIESTINRENQYMIDKIADGRFDVVAFCTYIWNIEKTLEIAEKIKKEFNVPIILGGPEVSYRAKSVLKNYSYADYVISGEGEESFPALLNAIENNLTLKIPGVSYRENRNSIISIPEKPLTGTPANPYCDEFFDNLEGRITYIETSRGCPYRCAFCLSGRCSPLRFFNIESVKKNIIMLANSGTKTVKFVDRTFNANEKRANEIISFILKKRETNEIPENVCFHFEIAGDILKESTMNLLQTAPKGLFQLEIGMQSFNEDTLKAINRKTDTNKLKNNIQQLISFGNMHIHIDLIAGLPLEDMQSFEKSFDTGFLLKANMLQLGFLKLLYGADMRENKEKYPCKYIDKPPYEVTETPWLTKNEIFSLKKCEDALDRLYNSGRFLFTVDYLINECDYSPFRLFFKVGNAIDGNKMSLSQYAVEIYDFFKEKIDSELLREVIICDLLSCSSALQIPDVLKRQDPLYKQAKKLFAQKTQDKIQIAVLYKTQRVFVVNQSKPKGFDNRYEGKFYDINNLI